MSRLTETKRAYDRISTLLDKEVLNRRGDTKELARFRETLNVAFYLVAFAQFEHLVKKEAKDIIEQNAALKTLDGRAWQYIALNIKGMPLRKQLDMIFHGDHKLLAKLHSDYDVRNSAAHDYKTLPKEAADISSWVQELEELIDGFS